MIKSVGYTKEGLIFFQLLTTYEGKPLETFVQFSPESAVGFCKEIMKAVERQKEAQEVTH